ncbi:MAG: hypothetical protein ACRCUT_11905, partial [Spirochaetota bacterium]
SKIIAVGSCYYDGTGSAKEFFYLSKDGGDSWTTIFSGSNASASIFWSDAAISDDGSKIIASESNGTLYWSTTGGAAYENNSALTFSWMHAVLSADGSIGAVTSTSTANPSYYVYECAYSDSTFVWTTKSPINDNSVYPVSIALSANGSLTAVGIYGGSIYIGIRDDTYVISWRVSNSLPTGNWLSIACSSTGQYIIAADYSGGYLWRSADYGNTWSQISDTGNQQWCTVAISQDGTFIAAASQAGSVIISADRGLTWKSSEKIFNTPGTIAVIH